MQCALPLYLGCVAGDQAGTERRAQDPEAGPEGARREEFVFETIAGLARWASSHALGTAE